MNALDYATRGWPVFPCHPGIKRPLTVHGLHDASADPTTIESWWRRWPDAWIGVPTGEAIGAVVLDIDVKRPAANGYDTLDDLGFGILPDAPMAHTTSGGLHVYFKPPPGGLRNTTGKLGRGIGAGLDWRGDGGYVIVPSPGSSYSWDPHQNFDTVPLAEVPMGLLPRSIEPPHVDNSPRPVVRLRLSTYGEKALDNAIDHIVHALAGEQRDTLNREVYGIARLVAGGVIPSPLALDALHWAARQMQNHNPRRPWRSAELQKAVQAAFLDGLRHPRRPSA
jgi:putative DNA primase/helicase